MDKYKDLIDSLEVCANANCFNCKFKTLQNDCMATLLRKVIKELRKAETLEEEAKEARERLSKIRKLSDRQHYSGLYIKSIMEVKNENGNTKTGVLSKVPTPCD